MFNDENKDSEKDKLRLIKDNNNIIKRDNKSKIFLILNKLDYENSNNNDDVLDNFKKIMENKKNTNLEEEEKPIRRSINYYYKIVNYLL